MIKAILFDLDTCLCAANEVGEQLFDKAFTAMRKAGQGVISEAVLRQAFQDCWRFPFDHIVRKYQFTPEMTAAGWNEFTRTAVTQPMHGYGDLDVLASLPAALFLVTSGFRRLQESKINALGISHLFVAIHIDALDENARSGKEPVFRNILTRHAFQPGEVMVVGDNPDSEIQAGNHLGMVTTQILRPGVSRGGGASHYVHDLRELKELLEKLR